MRIPGPSRFALVSLMLALGACGGGGGSTPAPIPPPPPPPPDSGGTPDPRATGFESGEITPDAGGVFTIGMPPETVSFSGGQAGTGTNPTLVRSGTRAWHIAPGATGRISFETPAESVELYFRQELPVTGTRQGCGVADRGNDNTAAFGAELFVRGEFNDWANDPEPGPPYLLVNAGDGSYIAEFELQAGEYAFKLADAGWSVAEYGNTSEVIMPGQTVQLAGVVPDGGPNSSLAIAEAGCYRWTLRIEDGSVVPAPVANLTVATAVSTGGELRVFDVNDAPIAAVIGTNEFALVSMARGTGESGVAYIEVENHGGDAANTAVVAVDDFVFSPITGDGGESGELREAEALLSGFNLSPATDSFATGLASMTVDDVSGALSGSVRLAGVNATGVAIRLNGIIVATLVRDAIDENLWRVAGGTVLDAAQLQAYLNGELEVVVYTAAYGNGEIAGRLLPDDVVLLPDNGSIAERSARDEIIYFVMTDRFYNGDPANDDGDPPGTISSGGYDPFGTGTWHGGDFAGLTAKLDYLHGLGITAIWVTPPVANSGPNAYHGYWAVDFENVDPHLGSNDDYRGFIDAAHARGIKVYQDVVINHTADVIYYAENQYSYRPLSEPPYTPVVPAQYTNAKNPAWLNDPQYYHNRGNALFNGGESDIYGDFFGLDDIATEIPFVRTQFIDIFQGWVGNFDVDGFRLDTAKHVRIDFWTEFAPALSEYAASIGKDNLTMFGEVFDGNPENVGRFVTTGRLPSMLNFPLHFTIPGAFGNTRSLDDLFAADDRFTDADTDARDLVNFFGNHDIGRAAGILRGTLPGLDDDGQVAAIGLAYAMNYFLRGVPTVYYGDEQGFPGDGGDQGAREDMMASRVPSYNDNDLVGTEASTAVDNFDQSHPVYRRLSRYAEVYKQHAALRRGVQLQRYSQTSAGLYAVSRVLPEDRMEYLVAFNTAATVDSETIVTGSPDATWYAVWPAGNAPLVGGGDGSLTVSVPGRDFVIYRSDVAMAEPAPVVSLSFPDLSDGQPVDGLVEVRTDLQTSDLVRVAFETSIDNGPFELAGVDYSAPFRLYWDSDGAAAADTVTIRASVVNPAGDTVSTEVDLLVENRVLNSFTPLYENGNDRSELVVIDSSGEVIGPAPAGAADGFIGIDDDLTLIYQDRTAEGFVFDRPIFIDRATLYALAEESAPGELSATVYINNAQELSANDNFLGSGQPATLDFDPAAPAPFGATALYARGSFNDWAADNALAYEGNYTYRGVLENLSGELLYKIADADWSADANFGAPYTVDGLSVGPGSADLADGVNSGTYDFYFFSVPDGGRVLNFHQLIERPDPQANNPYGVAVFVRGSFNDWGLGAPMSYDEPTSTFSAILTLDAATHEFKIASEDWNMADFGGDGMDNSVVPGEAKSLVRSSNNLELTLGTPGSYEFSVDASESETPVLIVTPQP